MAYTGRSTVETTDMHAEAGDQLVILSRTLDHPVRDGEIVEARGPAGSPPFLVRWAEDGRTTLVFPGPDARVHPLHHRKE